MHKILCCLLFTYLLLSLPLASSVYAQNPAPVHTIDGEYIREWLLLGPFFPGDLDTDFLADMGGEANIDPREGDTVIIAEGETLTWKRYKAKGYMIDLLDAVGNHENSTAYAFCVLQSEVPRDGQIHIGHDNGAMVWVNGEQVYSNPRIGAIDGYQVETPSKLGANSFLIKVSQNVDTWSFASRVEIMPSDRAVVSGTIADETGKPVLNASVRLEQDGEEIAETTTGSSGSYRLNIHPVYGEYDLFATRDDMGALRSGIRLREGDRRTLDLTLRKAISIEGTLLMLDNRTPHVAAVVQAISDGKVMATTLSDGGGKYQLINLKPGRYQVRCQITGGYVYYGEDRARESASQETGRPENEMMSSKPVSLQIEVGRALENIDFRFVPFKKGTWRNYTSFDGLPYNVVRAIYRDPDGVLWIGTGKFGDHGGVSLYDGTRFVDLTTPDKLAPRDVWAVHRDPDGVMWFATLIKGVFRYDGKEFINLTTQDGLAHNLVQAIHRDTDGIMWFGTQGGGVSRYDGTEFINFNIKDGLAGNSVYAMHRDPDGAMWFGTGGGNLGGDGGGVSRYDGKEFVSFTKRDGLANNQIASIHRDPDGVLWFGTGGKQAGGGGGGVSRYDGRKFINFTVEDGLASNCVLAIHRDPDGVMWFGTDNGVSRYDGSTFVNFTTDDGLAHNIVYTIYADTDGVKWFGTEGGLSRYDPEGLINFTTRDGLVDNDVWNLHRVSEDELWVGTMGGASRFDGQSFVNFTTQDGLTSNRVRAVHVAPDGVVWFATKGGGISLYDGEKFTNSATRDVSSGGVFTIYRAPDGVMWFGTNPGAVRYDGEEFVTFYTTDGLVHNDVVPIYGMPDGVMWFGTGGGVSRYDGKEFMNFTTEDGLASIDVNAIHHAPDGVLWFGTAGGLSLYDGEGFTNLTKEDGLVHNSIRAIFRDSDDILWFGTEGGSVGMYDGTAWSSLDTRDGLAGDEVRTIDEDSDGYLWFGTDGGITRYRRGTVPPKVHIVSVTTDLTFRLKTQNSRQKIEESSIPAFTIGTRVTIKYSAIDLKTNPEKRQYRSRIKEIDLGWSKPTKSTESDWTPQKAGTYTFEVQAIDRDLNYSEPASLELTILSPFYLRAAFLVPTIGFGMIILGTLVILVTAWTKRRRQVHAYERAAAAELQDARQMQMALLPEVAPQVGGMEVAGRCITANTVGGDFFDYLMLPDEKIGIAIGDVSGKGLKAAMNAVMASGMLYEVVKAEVSCGRILSVMNAGLYPRAEKQMFTAFSFAIIDQDAGVIQWSNAAQPTPLVKRSDGVSEAEEDGQLPLGMAPDVKYPNYERKLQSGDIIIFYTDGIIEAENEAEEMYGTERLLNLVAGIDSAANAEGVIEAILQDIAHFVGNAEQYDDITVVVAKKV